MLASRMANSSPLTHKCSKLLTSRPVMKTNGSENHLFLKSRAEKLSSGQVSTWLRTKQKKSVSLELTSKQYLRSVFVTTHFWNMIRSRRWLRWQHISRNAIKSACKSTMKWLTPARSTWLRAPALALQGSIVSTHRPRRASGGFTDRNRERICQVQARMSMRKSHSQWTLWCPRRRALKTNSVSWSKTPDSAQKWHFSTKHWKG